MRTGLYAAACLILTLGCAGRDTRPAGPTPRRLYLARHAQAATDGVSADRPLSARGVADARAMAELLRPLHLRLGVVWHSGLARAEQTADILARVLSTGKGVTGRRGLLPNDPVVPVAAEIVAAKESLMIVGHRPFLRRLIALLIGGEPSADPFVLSPGTVLCLEPDDAGLWRVLWVASPDLLPQR